MIHALALVMKFVKVGGKKFVPVDVLHDTNLMEEREFLLHVCFNVTPSYVQNIC